MRRKRLGSRLLLGWLAAAFVNALPAEACGPQEVCADVSSSFYGQVTVGIRLTWDTDSEDATVAFYKLKRYDCGDPGQCSVDVTTIEAIGTCNTTEEYEYTDSPPAGNWTYILEVWKSDNTRACAVDVVPE